eukprot:TRINITY_DN4563_c0_g1_i1.p2 TRINITY_DN4563_c0_g1~~TRINITY_DN4563_c0_g1_i1.p2  ORF type:complete len:283 (+),score=95.25 TRINITY_DN4563_c0_g1_i1:938-1786(+)
MGATLSQKMLERLEGSHRNKVTMFSEAPPVPVTPKDMGKLSLENISYVELARQLTILESSMFVAIQPHELLNSAWTSKDKEKLSPNVVRLTSQFNKCCRWVILSILKANGLKSRTKMLQLFIKTADECRKLNNYNALFEIMGALQNSSIHRLKKTYEPVTYEAKKAYEEMKVVSLPDKSWKLYRNVLKTLNPPCVPFIGVHQTDLIFIEEGNLTKQNNGLVNFRKCRLVAKTIQELQQMQNQPYNLAPVVQIQQLIVEGIKEAEHETMDSLYELSLLAEPRI